MMGTVSTKPETRRARRPTGAAPKRRPPVRGRRPVRSPLQPGLFEAHEPAQPATSIERPRPKAERPASPRGFKISRIGLDSTIDLSGTRHSKNLLAPFLNERVLVLHDLPDYLAAAFIHKPPQGSASLYMIPKDKPNSLFQTPLDAKRVTVQEFTLSHSRDKGFYHKKVYGLRGDYHSMTSQSTTVLERLAQHLAADPSLSGLKGQIERLLEWHHRSVSSSIAPANWGD
jgi:hypothetical protein